MGSVPKGTLFMVGTPLRLPHHPSVGGDSQLLLNSLNDNFVLWFLPSTATSTHDRLLTTRGPTPTVRGSFRRDLPRPTTPSRSGSDGPLRPPAELERCEQDKYERSKVVQPKPSDRFGCL